eukprot:CAMPEP_0116936332 /NCGR_PEP_ID=MMETSP0467-20121206/30823_1 /TAXON_ID=283647 /ORGANISM="Mesodinium pulex, Strain SPMC105" /LENGTH=69 /DNA_ID=CAMNT_0004617891 /DNA_START=2608 /DNA_END=2817 /DNA_ORIENTATION=+
MNPAFLAEREVESQTECILFVVDSKINSIENFLVLNYTRTSQDDEQTYSDHELTNFEMESFDGDNDNFK